MDLSNLDQVDLSYLRGPYQEDLSHLLGLCWVVLSYQALYQGDLSYLEAFL